MNRDKMTRTILVGAALLALSGVAIAKGSSCTTIMDGVLEYSAGHYLAGEPLELGNDPFGYNYNARRFSGSYANTYLGTSGYPAYAGDTDGYLAENPGAAAAWYWPYRDVDLSMTWNDAWLSNCDCDDDGALDRHAGYASYRGSGAWITNHMSGEDVDEDGKTYKWTYFVKIIAAPADATIDEGVFFDADGNELGPVIWSDFFVALEINSGSGPEYLSPSGPGFGK